MVNELLSLSLYLVNLFHCQASEMRRWPIIQHMDRRAFKVQSETK